MRRGLATCDVMDHKMSNLEPMLKVQVYQGSTKSYPYPANPTCESRWVSKPMTITNSETGTSQRRLRKDMRKELVAFLDNKGGKTKGGMKWTEVVKMLGEQSSVKVDAVEFAEVVRGLENEGVLKVVGEREKRVIRRID